MANRKIRTLIVDDSVFMRTMLKSALARSENVEVVGGAQNGHEALAKIKTLKPDVITLDIEMPGLTGLEVLERVMKENPLPIVMVSTKTQEGAQQTFEALELGAVDYVPKPLSNKGASLQSFQAQVVRAVETAFACNRARLPFADKVRILRPRETDNRTDIGVIAIGISAGGPATLHKLLPVFPKSFPPVLVTQHMPADFTRPFAERLNQVCQMDVKEARTGDELRPGSLLLAPGDRHLRVRRSGGQAKAVLDDGPKVSGFRPSVDVLLESVARSFGGDAIGLVMTGMGADGAEGIRKLKAIGARTLAQDQESSIVYGMPKAAADTGCVDHIVSLAEIPDTLARLLTEAHAVMA